MDKQGGCSREGLMLSQLGKPEILSVSVPGSQSGPTMPIVLLSGPPFLLCHLE